MDQYHSHLKAAVDIPGIFKHICLNFFMNGPLRFIGKMVLRHHIKIAYEILSNFIYVHEHVISELRTVKSHEAILGNKEALQLSYENKRNLENAKEDLREYEILFPEIIMDLSAKTAARVLLEQERSMTLKEYEEGEIMANEMNEILMENRKALSTLRIEEEPWQFCEVAGRLPSILEIIHQNNRQHPYRTLGVLVPEIVEELSLVAEERFFDHGDVVFTCGDVGKGIYYIGRGAALLCGVLSSGHGDEKLIRNVVNDMENSYNQDIKQFRERRSKVIAKKSRRASQPINHFFGPGGNNVEKNPKKNAIETRTQHW